MKNRHEKFIYDIAKIEREIKRHKNGFAAVVRIGEQTRATLQNTPRVFESKPSSLDRDRVITYFKSDEETERDRQKFEAKNLDARFDELAQQAFDKADE